ncbi:MAG: N-6 DNA methylase [Planctomycetota bacterium]
MTFRHLRNVRGFFSDYYLGSVFGRGAGRGRRSRPSDRDVDRAYGRFQRLHERAESRAMDAASCREHFTRPLLRDVLDFHLGAGEERLHGLFASAADEASGAPPLLLAYCGGWDEDLDAGRGAVQPARRLGDALARRGLGHGILVTGERLRLLRPPGEGPRGACLEADLVGLAEEEDPESFAALLRLFSAASFLPGPEGRPPIERIERESREHAERVSEDLKGAVFAAAESLVAGLLQDAAARGRIASSLDLTEPELRIYRDAALLALYRILFILYAEARDPRLDEHGVYRQSYSAQGLLEEILADPARDWAENRSAHWDRLRALFRIYDEGLPPITPWQNIPPRGGDFFHRETPEGRLLDEARLPDRAVTRLILDLATTAPRRGVGRERVSFRQLDIENLGAVYEGLLEYEPRIARAMTLEVSVQGRVFALVPAELVRLCREKSLALRGELALVAGTEAEALHPGAVADDEQEALGGEGREDEEPDEEAEGGESEAGEEDQGVRRGTGARLLRRREAGEFHFVPGPGRKGSGSFYTPRPLVQDLVRHALGPLVAGRAAAEILRLRVLDPACGSAHFLVEAMRFLGRALHRAYAEEFPGHGPSEFRSTTGRGWDDDWRATDGEARAANSEARAWCKRRIAERCLFGVDLNPTAVQLARVALWIESVAGDRPLTYFEHHVRNGNSLLGTWSGRLEAPVLTSSAFRRELTGLFPFQQPVRAAIAAAARSRRLIDEAEAEGLRREGVEPESVEEQELKEHLRRTAGETLAAAKLLFDLRSASAFVPEIWREWETLCSFIGDGKRLAAHARRRPWWETFVAVRDRERFFHWELEFPEVFLDGERPGFDAVLSNPPWDKVLPTKKEFYGRHDVLIRAYTGNAVDRRIQELHDVEPKLRDGFAEYRIHTRTRAEVLRKSGDFPLSRARSAAAHEDVSKYFVDRAARLAASGGAVGMVVPSVLYNGDGCVGLRRFLVEEATIERFYGFENRRKIFPIDSRYKFVSLVFRTGRTATEGFEAAFMRHDLAELEEEGPQPWTVRMTREEIQRLSPETFAFLEYRGPEDQRIVHRMYRGNARLDTERPGDWAARLLSWRTHEVIFNSAEDRDLFSNPSTAKLYQPADVLDAVPLDPDELLSAMRARGFWPVFEGKHIDQFVVGTKPVRWWLRVEQAKAKYGKPPRAEPTLVFRETASNTNERTCIAAVLPSCSAASHTLTGVVCRRVDPAAAAMLLNSFCFDFALRLRTAGTHVSFTYILPMPVPPAEVVNALPRLPTLLAWREGVDHVANRRDPWPLLWDANRAVAEAYGLGPADFAHILSTFPVFARKRPEFFAYLHARLAEWSAVCGERIPAGNPGEGEDPVRRVAESESGRYGGEGTPGS